MSRPLPLLAVVILLAGCAGSAQRTDAEAAPAAKTQSIRPFAWPPDQAPLPVRGGSSTGATVTRAPEPSPAWTALQAAPQGLERDRAAIRAMVGDYRVTFDFQEIVACHPDQPLTAPYHSWATERIFILEDQPTRIVLQHQLVMRFAGKSDEVSVIKHWRQDWTWQDGDLLRYQGLGVWRHERVDAATVAGCWTQTIYGVGDEPRFASFGRWQHSGADSEWLSDRHWRPLPRREYSVRSDYQALDGTDRIVITAGGWVLFQENRKLPVSTPGTAVPAGPLALEIGCERYERITGFDWSPGIAEWNEQAAAWAQVRDAWTKRLAAPETRLDEEQKVGAGLLDRIDDKDLAGALSDVRGAAPPAK